MVQQLWKFTVKHYLINTSRQTQTEIPMDCNLKFLLEKRKFEIVGYLHYDKTDSSLDIRILMVAIFWETSVSSLRLFSYKLYSFPFLDKKKKIPSPSSVYNVFIFVLK